ncbi:MAG: glycan-binding surface protein [Lewinella sp.]|jgi:hypothetical protein|uniref:glycan-binding surface protein n=1 Tax=Lewinella sp. TaxID=2004506 RepID=UPI003D6C429E
MKILNKSTLLFAFCLMLVANFTTSCSEDDMPGAVTDVGNPEIFFIRSTEPTAADSLLTGAFMGGLIAIVGQDLQHTVEIWFNDQPASLNPAYITSETILVNVPSSVPVEVNDKMRLVFANGQELLYDFKINVPSPIVTKIKSEYVATGDMAILTGDFFFEPVTVTFSGGVEAQIASLDKTQLAVIVPEGVEPGPISISTNFGVAVSDFLFRDDRNVALNYDDRVSRSWNSPIGTDLANGGFAPCDNGYTYFKMQGVGAWQWVNELNMFYDAADAETGRGNIPIFPSTASVNDWGLRFEINVAFDWREIPLEIFFGDFASGPANCGRDVPEPMVRWSPWEANGLFVTDGWETVTIPLTAFNIDKDGNPAELDDLSPYTNMGIMFFGDASSTHDVNMAIDNVRVVKL